MSHRLCLGLCLYPSVYLSVCVSMFVSLSLIVPLPLSLRVSLCVSVSLSLSPSPRVSVPPFRGRGVGGRNPSEKPIHPPTERDRERRGKRGEIQGEGIVLGRDPKRIILEGERQGEGDMDRMGERER